MTPSILALSTAVPPHLFPQEMIKKKMISVLNLDDEKKAIVEKLYENSAIKTRYSVLPDFQGPPSDWHFWGHDYPSSVPGMSKRNDIYKKEAPQLAHQAAEKAIKNWGGDPSEITHVISVSCTGVIAPGIEFKLMKSLPLKPSTSRLGINFMGCFGAFKGLHVAQSLAKEDKKHRILVVCTELCSLHLQADYSLEILTANSLFSDGAAAVIVGVEPRPHEKSLWEMVTCRSLGLDNSLDKMGWEASDQGFVMSLSPFVPALIGRHIQPFVESLLGPNLSIADCDCPVHPGGKSIVQAVEKALSLDKSQTQASWNTLANYGNMSSSTFLFVLDELYSQQNLRDWAIGLGFGPGLSMEGILLRKSLN